MIQTHTIVLIDQDACTGCGVCVAMCPQRILSLDAATGKCQVSDEKRCDRLAGCERACPTGAIRIGR
jgi:NAD-dependent dihydropyrimidine dehydrogenase PreA subunit